MPPPEPVPCIVTFYSCISTYFLYRNVSCASMYRGCIASVDTRCRVRHIRNTIKIHSKNLSSSLFALCPFPRIVMFLARRYHAQYMLARDTTIPNEIHVLHGSSGKSSGVNKKVLGACSKKLYQNRVTPTSSSCSCTFITEQKPYGKHKHFYGPLHVQVHVHVSCINSCKLVFALRPETTRNPACLPWCGAFINFI